MSYFETRLRALFRALRVFFRAVLGPTKDEVWRAVAAEIGADFLPAGPWGGSKVRRREGDWIIALETYKVRVGDSSRHYPCVRALFSRGGASPEEVGDLFSNGTIQRLVGSRDLFGVTVYQTWFEGSPLPPGVSELFLDIRRFSRNPTLIKDRLQVFVEVLKHLDREIRDSQDEVERLCAILTNPGGKIERRGLAYWDGDPPRHRAAEELIRLKDVRAVPGFISALNDSDSRLRGKAIFALGELGDKGAVPALIPLLGDRSPAGYRSAAGHAADALRKLDEEGIVAAFEAGLAGDLEGLIAVARRHRIHILSALLNLLRGSGLSSAQAAVRGLVELGATEALPALRKEAVRLGKRAAAQAGIPAGIAALESRATLPRPASAAEPVSDTLPRSAAEPGPDTTTLPRAVEDSDTEGC